jgi:hypothetical protein
MFDLFLEFFEMNGAEVKFLQYAISREFENKGGKSLSRSPSLSGTECISPDIDVPSAHSRVTVLRDESVAAELLNRTLFRSEGKNYLRRTILPVVVRIASNDNNLSVSVSPALHLYLVCMQYGLDPRHTFISYCGTRHL